MYQLLKADELLPGEQWEEFHNLRTGQIKTIPYNYTDIDLLKKDYISEYYQGDNFLRYLILKDDKIIGDFCTYLKNDKEEDTGEVIKLNIYVIPESQSDEMIRVVFNKIISHYNNNHKILLNAKNNIHENWYKRFGGLFKFGTDDYILKYKDINHAVINNWLENIPEKNSEFRLEFHDYTKLSENYLKQFTRLWEDSLNNEPFFDFSFSFLRNYKDEAEWMKNKEKNENKTLYDACILLNDKDKIIGLSMMVIDIEKSNDKPVKASIGKGMTGVDKEYWGKKLWKMDACCNI